MMRMFCLEIKRLVKSRRNLTLILITLVMAIVMAWLPVMFESVDYPVEGGNMVKLNGLDAIAYKKSIRYPYNGEITPEKLKKALLIYQETVTPYGEKSIDSGEFPIDIYMKKIFPILPLLSKLPETYADSKTGMGVSLMDIEPDSIDVFYEQTTQHLRDVMRLEQKDYIKLQKHALEQYNKVHTPFQLYAGYSKDAFDYIELYVFILIVLSTAIIAPTFSNEYQTGADSILRSTKNGRLRLAITKILAALIIFILLFIVCMSLHLLTSNLAFGPECMKTSMQLLFSVVNLPALNLGQLQMVLASGGLLSLLSTISFTLFLSAKCKDSLTVIILALTTCLLPIFAYTALGANWLSAILPCAGAGLQNNLLYQLNDFNYLYIGAHGFWTPYVIIIASVVEIPLFLFLATRVYCSHQVH